MKKNVGIIGVPIESGQNYPGYRDSPEYLRKFGLVETCFLNGCNVKDYGNLEPVLVENDSRIYYAKKGKSFLRNVAEISEYVNSALEFNDLIIVLGGDNSISFGSMTGHTNYHFNQLLELEGSLENDPVVCMVNVSLRPNLHTIMHRKSSGHVTRMINAMLIHEMQNEIPWINEFANTPSVVNANNIGIIGVQEVDAFERYMIEKYDIKTISTETLDRIGISAAVDELIRIIDPKKENFFHLSVNVEAFSPYYCKSCLDPILGGLTNRESIYIAESLCKTGRLRVLEITGFNSHMGSDMENDKTCSTIMDTITAAVGRKRGGKAYVDPQYYDWQKTQLKRSVYYSGRKMSFSDECHSFSLINEEDFVKEDVISKHTGSQSNILPPE